MSEKKQSKNVENEEVKQEENGKKVGKEEIPAAETPAEETQDAPITGEEEEQIQQLAKLLAEGNDKYLRLAAEYDNYRKRTTKEKENIYSDAKVDTVKPFLDVYDNLVRGLAQCEEGDSHRQGLEMIAKQFLTVLEKLGVKEIEAEGQPFDPEKHNAVMHVEDENFGENTVVEVFQKGFMLNDKVIRFAMVKVAN